MHTRCRVCVASASFPRFVFSVWLSVMCVCQGVVGRGHPLGTVSVPLKDLLAAQQAKLKQLAAAAAESLPPQFSSAAEGLLRQQAQDIAVSIRERTHRYHASQESIMVSRARAPPAVARRARPGETLPVHVGAVVARKNNESMELSRVGPGVTRNRCFVLFCRL